MESEKSLPLATTEEQELQDLAARSDLVFEGFVLTLGRPSQNRSGYMTEYQSVRYRVQRVLKGKYSPAEISVDHVIVSDSKMASADMPSPLPRLFAPNSRLIVSVRKADDRSWKALDENYSALPADPEWIKKIEAALKSHAR